MPQGLTGRHAAQDLRTILESAKTHGRGTMNVEQTQVSYRSTLGRIFKGTFTNNHSSIDNFKNLLLKAYPNSQDKIAVVMGDSYAKGRLTTGAVQRAYRKLHEDHKFKITYPSSANTIEQRLQFEDRRALGVLQDPKTIANVCDQALKLANHIENSQLFTDWHAAAFLQEHLDRQPFYPVHADANLIPKDKAGLVNFLRSTANGSAPDKQVLLLSMMWMLPKRVGETEGLGEVKTINRLYKVKIHDGKQHIQQRETLLKSITTLNQAAVDLSHSLRRLPKFTDQAAANFAHKHFNKQRKYLADPNTVMLPQNKVQLMAFLKTPAQATDPDRCVLLSAMLKDQLKATDTKSQAILMLYKTLVKNGNTHQEFNQVTQALTKPGTFGNTEIASTLMDRFLPHQKEREAVKVMSKPNERVQKFLANGNPYISGFSGMANCGSSIFPLLNIDMTSENGKLYGEALAAFIVGAGEHSYPEAYKSLNLSLRYLQLGQQLA